MIVEDLSTLALTPEDARHLSSVLRLRDGEEVGATDGRGGYVACAWAAGRLSALGPPVVLPPRVPALTVGFVPVKGDRPEWAVQKLTELGVDHIVLLSSQRSVVRWEGRRLESHLDRLRRVARAAVMQSRQVWLPSVAGVESVASMAGVVGSGGAGGGGGGGGRAGGAGGGGRAGGAGGGGRHGHAGGSGHAGGLAVADVGGGPLGPGVHTVLIGPEGGWSDAERDIFATAGIPAVGLGPAVLRAETAAAAAGVLMAALRAGLVASAASPQS